MKLMEIMSLGDDNVLGKLFDTAIKNIKAVKQNDKNKKDIGLLLNAVNKINNNPNLLQTDGYSLIQYIKMLNKPNLDDRTIKTVCDALCSYDDSTE